MVSHTRIYPAALLLEGQSCLVVGAGKVAARKAAGLLAAGANVTAIAPEIDPEFAELDIAVQQRCYRPGDVAGHRVVVAATGDRATDAAVYSDGETLGVLVNAADDPTACSFFLPAILRRGRVTISVSTAGGSPAFASWLRDTIAGAINARTELLADTIAMIRDELREAGYSSELFNWKELIDSLAESAETGASSGSLSVQGQAWKRAELIRLRARREHSSQQ